MNQLVGCDVKNIRVAHLHAESPITDYREEFVTLITEVVEMEPRVEAMVESELEEICEDVHGSCDSSCPIYQLNHGTPDSVHNFKINRGCDCFKNGAKMLEFIKTHQ